MKNKKNDKYHIKILSPFILTGRKFFKSGYSQWVYIYLKLLHNYHLQFKNQEYYKINTEEIGFIFSINKATVFDCLNELYKYKLLEKSSRNNYKLLKENRFVDALIEANLFNNKDNERFLPIYYNFFLDLLDKGAKPRDFDVYYYMVHQNKHYALNNEFLEVNNSQSQICKELGIDHRTLKQSINKLIDFGALMKNKEGLLFTKSSKPDCITDNSSKQFEIFEEPMNYYVPEYKETANEPDVLPKNIIGWKKILNGQYETAITRHPKFGIVQGPMRLADGIPPSQEEIRKWDEVLNNKAG